MAGEQLESPNKQAVGLEPPWVEGTGGAGGRKATRGRGGKQQEKPQEKPRSKDDEKAPEEPAG